jgi:hypothetical protein
MSSASGRAACPDDDTVQCGCPARASPSERSVARLERAGGQQTLVLHQQIRHPEHLADPRHGSSAVVPSPTLTTWAAWRTGSSS